MENEPQAGAPGSPVPAASPQGAPTSVDVEALLSAFKSDPRFASLVKEVATPAFQSIKDRRLDQQDKRLTTVESVVAEYQALRDEGLSHKVAMRLMSQEGDPQAEPAAQASPAAVGKMPGSVAQPQSVTAEDLEVMGLNANDPDVVKLLWEGKNSRDDFFALAKARKARTPAPNPASVLPGGGGQSVPVGDDAETLTAELNQAMQNPTKNMPKIRELKARLETLLPKA